MPDDIYYAVTQAIAAMEHCEDRAGQVGEKVYADYFYKNAMRLRAAATRLSEVFDPPDNSDPSPADAFGYALDAELGPARKRSPERFPSWEHAASVIGAVYIDLRHAVMQRVDEHTTYINLLLRQNTAMRRAPAADGWIIEGAEPGDKATE